MKDKELLTKLVEGLKTLKEEEFLYEAYVNEYDEENDCGTVCCAWGWMPRFVPESGVKWTKERSWSGKNVRVVTEDPDDYEWEYLSEKETDFMFFGFKNPFKKHNDTVFGNSLESKLPQVINRIEYIINRL